MNLNADTGFKAYTPNYLGWLMYPIYEKETNKNTKQNYKLKNSIFIIIIISLYLYIYAYQYQTDWYIHTYMPVKCQEIKLYDELQASQHISRVDYQNSSTYFFYPSKGENTIDITVIDSFFIS